MSVDQLVGEQTRQRERSGACCLLVRIVITFPSHMQDIVHRDQYMLAKFVLALNRLAFQVATFSSQASLRYIVRRYHNCHHKIILDWMRKPVTLAHSRIRLKFGARRGLRKHVMSLSTACQGGLRRTRLCSTKGGRHINGIAMASDE